MIIPKYLHRKKVVTNPEAQEDLRFSKAYFYTDKKNTPCELFSEPMAGNKLSGFSNRHLNATQRFRGSESVLTPATQNRRLQWFLAALKSIDQVRGPQWRQNFEKLNNTFSTRHKLVQSSGM